MLVVVFPQPTARSINQLHRLVAAGDIDPAIIEFVCRYTRIQLIGLLFQTFWFPVRANLKTSDPTTSTTSTEYYWSDLKHNSIVIFNELKKKKL